MLDAVDRPEAPLRDGPALAAWFAREISACALLVIGADGPDGTEVPVHLAAADAPDLPA